MIHILIFILGTIIGSFSNLVITRTIRDESIVYPRSHCDTCGQTLGPTDLVPIFSYVLHKGKCRYCKANIPIDNLIIELITGILFLIFFDIASPIKSLLLLAAIVLALIIAIIDIKTYDIYIYQVIILSLIGIVYRATFIGFDIGFIIRIAIFIGLYGMIYYFYRDSLGDGDIYFYLALFLFIENPSIFWMIIFSIWLGAIAGLIIAYKKKTVKIKLPFCIFIFLSFLMILLAEGVYL